MNNPEGYVLVQVKQLAQWREWANNVAAWSTKAGRSSEVARLKASISSAMISATQPTASNAGEREDFEAWADRTQPAYWRTTAWAREAWPMWRDMRAALASKPAEPVAPPAREADLLTQLIQRLNSAAYSLTKEECIEEAKKLRAERSATPPAQAVQDKEDAENYRWLRDKSQDDVDWGPTPSYASGHGIKVVWQGAAIHSHPTIFLHGENLDDAIRAARTRGNGVEPS